VTVTEKRAVVDELGQIEQDIAPLKDKEKRASELRAQVRTWFPKLASVTSTTVEGFKFICTVGAQENQRSIKDIGAVFKLAGSYEFLQRCTFTLKALKEIVTADKFEELTEETRTGTRPVKTFAKARVK
jgi:hypothetical protein